MLLKYLFIFTILSRQLFTESARILAVLPTPVLSHQMVFRVLTQELVKRGHQVTIITVFPLFSNGQAPTNYTEIEVHALRDTVQSILMKDIDLSEDPSTQFISTFKVTFYLTDQLLQTEGVKKLFQDKKAKFDLIFVEDCFKTTLIFSHVFKAPVIQISSFGGTFNTFEAVGAATHPFLYPLAIRKRFSNLSLWEKVTELFLIYRLQKAFHEEEILENELFKKHFGPNAPTTNELQKNIDMLFLNVHSIWDSNRPVPPNVIYLGGLHQKQHEELPKDLKSALDSSSNGVIYMSFGTNVDPSLLTKDKLQIFINVFSKLQFDVYWKWSDDNLPRLAKNIKVSKWFPQSDLLMHPKVKLFITQGGLQSTDEAIAGGVPLIGIPMMWDQWYNVDKYVQLKVGLQLDLNTITETKLKDAIETIIGDKRYKENIIKLHSMMRDQMDSPLERAVWWTEYVIRNGGASHLRAPSANMSWVEYYEVNLISYIVISIILILAILIILFRTILRLLLGNKIKND